MSTQSFKVKSGLTLTPVDLATLTNPQAGDLACDINDSNKIKRYDANSSAWTEVGSGGVGSVDVMFVQDFESASLSTFTQTGLSLSTTDPLHGKVSALLTHQAAINQSFKQIIPVDRKFRGQAMVLDLNVKSAASAGNVTIKITDETGSVDLIASEQLQLSNDVSGRRSSVSFTIPSTCESLSYTITALPEAGSPVTRIDDIVAMLSDVSLLETSVLLPNMTAWQGYTPTFQGFGTPTNVEFEWRQVGENVEIRGKFTSGAPTPVEARIGLPAGLNSAGTNLIPSIQIAGTAGRSGNSAAPYSSLIEPNISYVTLGFASGATGGILVKRNADAIVFNGESFSIQASVPCAGLSATTTKTIPLTQSGLVQEADSAFKARGFIGNGSTNTGVLRLSSDILSLGDAVTYNSSATLGDSWTVNTAGIYNVVASVDTSNTSLGIQYYISKNASILTANSSLPFSEIVGVVGYANPSSDVTQLGGSDYFNVGDVIRIQCNTAGASATNGYYDRISITYQGSLKQLNVSSDQKITIPTSELRFTGSSSRGTADSGTRVKFDTLASIRGDAFTVTNDATGTSVIMKKAGRLTATSSATSLSAGYYALIHSRLGTLAVDSITASGNASVSWTGDVQIGDILVITSAVNPVSNSGNTFHLSFQEQDISVSVTNTLPQFSESDTSLRLSGANGFGSTATTTRRFSSVLQNVGTDVQYVDSPTLGGQFIALASGIYNTTFFENSSSNTANSAIAINVNGVSVSGDGQVYNTASTAGKRSGCSWQGYLTQGDIVTCIVNSAAENNGAEALFTISKVGKPNVTGVDVTPFVNVPQQSYQSYVAKLDASNAPINILKNDNTGLFTVSVTGGRIRFTALKRIQIQGSGFRRNSSTAPTSSHAQWYLNGVLISDDKNFIGSGGSNEQASDAGVNTSLEIGEHVEFLGAIYSGGVFAEAGVSVSASGLSDQILTAPETFSTDTAALQYSSTYTLSTLQNAPVGTYITFTYAANTNTRTQTTGTNRPSQTDADMNANGIQIFGRAYNVLSTAAQPAVIAIQVGKGLKGTEVNSYASAAKTTATSYTHSQGSTLASEYGTKIFYDEKTGILTLDAGFTSNGSVTTKNSSLDLTTNTGVNSYFVINASKNPALTGLSLGSSVKAKYTSNSGQAVGTAATLLTMEDYVYDSNNAYTSGVYTVPENGTYIIAANWVTGSVAISASTGSMSILIYVDGVSVSSTFIRGTGNTLAHLTSITDQFVLRKGQTVSIYGACTSATTMSSGSFSITKFSAVKDS